MREIYVDNEDKQRLDSYLAAKLQNLSRTYINKLIKEGFIHVNKKIVKPRYMIKKGDLIEIEIPQTKKIELLPENIPIDVVYEDKDIIVINKSENMLVHPTDNNYSKTLVNALLYHIGRSSLSDSYIRPGIVHRLDKNTSGLLVIAKNNKSYKKLSQQFIDRSVKRIYLALVFGELDVEEAVINMPIGRNPINRTRMAIVDKGGKMAISYYKILERFEGYTLLELSLKTGRTHQIRVHMSHIGHPIVGDPIYTNQRNEFNLDKQLLHASKLAFYHPVSDDYMEFEIEPPIRFKTIIKLLRQGRGE